MRKTVIVTGGAGGIGSAVVKKFHNQGFNVVIGCNSSVSRAEVLATEIIADGGSAIAVSSDLSTADGCKRLIDAAIKRYGRVDVLINNCGKSLYGLFIDNTEETVRSCFDVNVMSAVFCSQYSINDMLKRKCGVIVNVSSMWGIVGASMEAVYSASKAAVIGLTKALAKEYAPSGIRVNCVAPGATATKMMDSFSDEDKQLIEEDIPLGRMALPDEIAHAVYFAAVNTYITGEIVNISGGSVV